MDAASHVAQLIEDLDPGAMVTRWVVVAEIIESDGNRARWMSNHTDATRWDLLGLLHDVIGEIEAERVVELLGGEQ